MNLGSFEIRIHRHVLLGTSSMVVVLNLHLTSWVWNYYELISIHANSYYLEIDSDLSLSPFWILTYLGMSHWYIIPGQPDIRVISV